MPFIGTRFKGRILDFDLENRPLSYWGENGTSEVTAIASCWADDVGSMEVLLLGECTAEEMFLKFLKRFNEASLITGHNIRGHDLPTLSGALMELGLPQLKPIMTQDTYLDLKKRKGIPASQEYLLALFDIGEKVHMTQHDWRESNRLGSAGRSKTSKRVVGDVYDHLRLRPELLRRNLLKPPKVWHP